jgi:hypothetical protein
MPIELLCPFTEHATYGDASVTVVVQNPSSVRCGYILELHCRKGEEDRSWASGGFSLWPSSTGDIKYLLFNITNLLEGVWAVILEVEGNPFPTGAQPFFGAVHLANLERLPPAPPPPPPPSPAVLAVSVGIDDTPTYSTAQYAIYRVWATVTNIGGADANDVWATLYIYADPPDAASLYSGDNPQALGTIPPEGSATAIWYMKILLIYPSPTINLSVEAVGIDSYTGGIITTTSG